MLDICCCGENKPSPCCYAGKSTRSLVLLQPPHELDGTMDSCREQFAAVNGNSLIGVITMISRGKSLVAWRFRVVLRSYMLFYSHFSPESRMFKRTRGAVQVLKSVQWRKSVRVCATSPSDTRRAHSTLLNTTVRKPQRHCTPTRCQIFVIWVGEPSNPTVKKIC